MVTRVLDGVELAAARARRRKWIRALLSGEFVQGKGELVSVAGEAHCCLGVACATLPRVAGATSYRIEGRYGEPDRRILANWQRRILANWQKLVELTVEGRALVGITGEDQRELIRLNDGGDDREEDSVPFDLIAWVLEHLPYEVDA